MIAALAEAWMDFWYPFEDEGCGEPQVVQPKKIMRKGEVKCAVEEKRER